MNGHRKKKYPYFKIKLLIFFFFFVSKRISLLSLDLLKIH
jgi:hypothetical protein